MAAEIRLDGSLAQTRTDVIVGLYREQRQCEDSVDCNENPDKVRLGILSYAYSPTYRRSGVNQHRLTITTKLLNCP